MQLTTVRRFMMIGCFMVLCVLAGCVTSAPVNEGMFLSNKSYVIVGSVFFYVIWSPRSPQFRKIWKSLINQVKHKLQKYLILILLTYNNITPTGRKYNIHNLIYQTRIKRIDSLISILTNLNFILMITSWIDETINGIYIKRIWH